MSTFKLCSCCKANAPFIALGIFVLFVVAAVLVPVIITVVGKPSPEITTAPISISNDFITTDLTLNSSMWNNTLWNVHDYTYGKDNIYIEDNRMITLYKNGSHNPSGPLLGGYMFYASPPTFPSKEVYFTYMVKFGNNFNFDFVKGGKLPGIYIGVHGANDGQHLSNGSSFRFMWRANGQAEGYIYVGPQQQGFYKLMGYVNNGIFGESIGRGFTNFVPGQWNKVAVYIKLNSIGNADGIMQFEVNNKTLTYNNMVWRTDPNMLINGLIMSSFFGGSDASWATPVDQVIHFTNFAISTPPPNV